MMRNRCTSFFTKKTMLRRHLIGFVSIGLLTWLACAGDPPPLTQDEQALKQAGVALDSPALLDYFRRRTPTEERQAALKQLVAQLGSSTYAVRLKATSELIQAGRASLPWLRETLKHRDTETARRAQHCIQIIEQNTRLGLSATASRVLADRKVPGTVETLVAYLPFIDEPWIEEEIRLSLRRLTLTDAKASAVLEAALSDAEPKRRGAAAWIVGQSEDAMQRQRVLARLADESAEVRFLAASSLVTAREPLAVPALIRLLSEGNSDFAWRSEDLLARLAGAAGPTVWLGSDNNGSKVRDAWEIWWKSHAAKIDWKTIRIDELSLGLTLVVENQRPDGGRIYECNHAGLIRWQVRIQNPIDAQWLPGGRILVADSRASQVYEIDTRGNIGWKHAGVAPTSCQRLPNGNTVISTYESIIEVTRDNKVVFTYATQGHTYHARKLADGHYVWIDAGGEIGEIDDKGKLVAKTKVGNGLAWGSIEKQRNGKYLVALGGIGKVQEMDLAGKVYWEKTVNNPNRAVRLANGHIVVASHGDQCVYEFDAQGNELWKHPCAGRPFTAQRR